MKAHGNGKSSLAFRTPLPRLRLPGSRVPAALILTALLVLCLCAPIVLAGPGEGYIEAYNALSRMYADRVALFGFPTNDMALKDITSTSASLNAVYPADLEFLRGKARSLMDYYFIVEPGNFDKTNYASAVAFPCNRAKLMGDIGKNGKFTKVPAAYTSSGEAVYAEAFSDVPLLWVHFDELYQAALKMRYSRAHGEWVSQGEITSKSGSGTHPTIWDNAVEDAKTAFLADPGGPGSGGPCAYSSGCYTWGVGWLEIGFQATVTRRLARYQVTGLASRPYTLQYYAYALAPNASASGEWDANGDAVESGRWTPWSVGSGASSSNMSSTLGSLSGCPCWCEAPVPGSGQETARGYNIEAHECGIAIVEWTDLLKEEITNPVQDDPDEDGLVVVGCECNECSPSADPVWCDFANSPRVTFPLGLSSGQTTGGLRVKAYVSEYEVGDVPRQMFSLDTAVTELSQDADEGWTFITVKRPTGAEVLFSFKGGEAGWPVNGNNTYRAFATNGGFEIWFGGEDRVVHRFGGYGKLSQVRATESHQEISLDGTSSLWPGMTTYRDGDKITRNVCPTITAVPTYSGSLMGSVSYQDGDGNELSDVGVSTGSRIFRTRDATGKVTDETRVIVDGDRSEIWYGVTTNNGVVAAKKEVRVRHFDEDDLSLTVTQTNIVRCAITGEQTKVSSKRMERMPWGYAVTRETVGVNTAEPWTTTYDYNTNVLSRGSYGRVRLVNRPDGTWTRYTYDGCGRTRSVREPFKNAGPTAPDSECRVTYYTYGKAPGLAALGFPSDDLVTTNDPRPRLVLELVQGFEVSRTYHAYLADREVTKRCAVAGAAYDDAANLTTTTYMYTDGLYVGRLRKRVNEDGRVTLGAYAYEATSNRLASTTRSGASGDGLTVTNGTESTVVTDAGKRTLTTTRRDAATGIVLSELHYTRDAFGRVTCSSNAVAGTWSRTRYGCCGPEWAEDADGIETETDYTDLKQVFARTRLGVTTYYEYDVDGNATRTRVAAPGHADRVTSTTFDAAGRRTSATDAMGGVTTYSYSTNSAGSRRTTVTLPDGASYVERSYRDGQPQCVTGAAAVAVCYDYGADADGAFTVEYRGATTSATEWVKTYVDLLGRQSKVVYPDGYTLRSYYDAQGRRIKEDDGLTVRLTEYGDDGQVLRSAVDVNGNGVIDLTGPDRIDQMRSGYTAVNGTNVRESVSLRYQTSGSATPVTVSMQHAAVDGSASWNTVFGLTTERTVTRDRAQARRVETVRQPDGVSTINTYSNNLLVSTVRKTVAGSVITSVRTSYDVHGQPSAVRSTAANGGETTTRTLYDAAGRATNMTVSAGGLVQTTTYEYDAMGRRIRTVLPDGGIVQYAHTARGELEAQSGARTYPVSYTFTDQGRLATMSTYRSGGQGSADTTTWSYDPQRAWLTAKTYADSSSVRYAYRPDGVLTNRTWARGVQTVYRYDAAGSLTNISYSDATPSVSYVLDRLGRTVGIEDAVGAWTNTYLANAQLGEVTCSGGEGHVLSYSCDEHGRATGFMLSTTGTGAMHRVGYGYDAAGRLAAVSNEAVTALYTYGADGVTVAGTTIGNGAGTVVQVDQTHDGLGRVLRRASTLLAGQTVSFDYTYNQANQRTRIEHADGGHWLYTYDDLGQVTSGRKYEADGRPVADAQFDYAYDTIGNRTRAQRSPDQDLAYEANELNQYTEISGTETGNGAVSAEARRGTIFLFGGHAPCGSAPTGAGTVEVTSTPAYDPDGNTLTNGTFAYTWNGENRLIAIESLPIVPTADRIRCEHRYDHQGRRTLKRTYAWQTNTWTLTATHTFIYDGWNLLADTQVSGLTTQVSLHTWGLDLSGTLQGAGGVSGALAMTRDTGTATNTYLYCFDGNGNVVNLVDASDGSIAATYEYSPFGQPLCATGPMASSNPVRWSTKHTDDETALVMYEFRPYSPTLGRWLSRDPIGESGGVALYGFVGNCPVGHVDPSGLYTIKDARRSLKRKGTTPAHPGGVDFVGNYVYPEFSDQQVFDEWLFLERSDIGWLNTIPDCPDRVCIENGQPVGCNNGQWKKLEEASQTFHPGASWCMRSETSLGAGQQCCYDDQGYLITAGLGAGTPDRQTASFWNGSFLNHFRHDVAPFNIAWEIDGGILGPNLRGYLAVRPPSQGGGRCYQ